MKINYGSKFKIEWAEGRTDETSKYTGKELCLQEFIYIITKRHHEIALENVENGFYGTYDKHKVWVKYNDQSDWEVLDRFDLGNDYDFKLIMDDMNKALDPNIDWYWSDLVTLGKELWESRKEQ